MTLTQILKMLVACILVITFILVSASAYRQHRTISSLAKLTDATSSIATQLAVDQLAHVDETGAKYSHVIDLARLENLTFKSEIGGENFEFQISINYQGSENLRFGPEPAENSTNCSFIVGCSLWSHNRFQLARLGVIAWRA
jgi:hypothetical protein